jgi:ketosteroid isomerase-like protein
MDLAAALISVTLVLAACGDDGSDAGSTDAGPASIIETHREAYNSGDIDGIMALFAEDSVVIGHPFSAESPVSRGLRQDRVLDVANRHHRLSPNGLKTSRLARHTHHRVPERVAGPTGRVASSIDNTNGARPTRLPADLPCVARGSRTEGTMQEVHDLSVTVVGACHLVPAKCEAMHHPWVTGDRGLHARPP